MPKMNDKWVRDTGLIFTLIFLIVGYRGHAWALLLSGLILVALLFFPSILWPFGYVWFKLAETLGKIMNKVFFGLVFFCIVTPIGYLRRLTVGDARDLTTHPDRESAFIDRNIKIKKEHITKPY